MIKEPSMPGPEREINPEIVDLQRIIENLKERLNWDLDPDVMKSKQDTTEEREKKQKNKFRDNYITSSAQLIPAIFNTSDIVKRYAEQNKDVQGQIDTLNQDIRKLAAQQHEFSSKKRKREYEKIERDPETGQLAIKEGANVSEGSADVVLKDRKEHLSMIQEMDRIIKESIKIMEKAIENAQEDKE